MNLVRLLLRTLIWVGLLTGISYAQESIQVLFEKYSRSLDNAAIRSELAHIRFETLSGYLNEIEELSRGNEKMLALSFELGEFFLELCRINDEAGLAMRLIEGYSLIHDGFESSFSKACIKMLGIEEEVDVAIVIFNGLAGSLYYPNRCHYNLAFIYASRGDQVLAEFHLKKAHYYDGRLRR